MRRAYLGWIVFIGVIAVGFAMVCLTKAVRAQGYGTDFSQFVGDYSGQVVIETPTGLAKRDLDVIVRREKEGFSLEWSTETQRPDGRIKSDRYFVAFKPAQRAGYYAPTDKIDRFGKRIPIDPIAGDPQLMAKIEGQTMTVYASLIADDGAHEVQTYERTLVQDGMKLKFSRVRNGEPVRAIEVDLKNKDQTQKLR